MLPRLACTEKREPRGKRWHDLCFRCSFAEHHTAALELARSLPHSYLRGEVVDPSGFRPASPCRLMVGGQYGTDEVDGTEHASSTQALPVKQQHAAAAGSSSVLPGGASLGCGGQPRRSWRRWVKSPWVYAGQGVRSTSILAPVVATLRRRKTLFCWATLVRFDSFLHRLRRHEIGEENQARRTIL
jgi:hypothetical protein